MGIGKGMASSKCLILKEPRKKFQKIGKGGDYSGDVDTAVNKKDVAPFQGIY